jgi:predicted RNase H-like HicB family nuclease
MASLSPRSYNVVLEPDEDGGYVAIVPAFPGCYSQGETVAEALANAREAIALTIDDMQASGESIPDPSGELVGKVAVGG